MLSLVIPCLNASGQLKATLESLKATTSFNEYPIEVVVVDDCSGKRLEKLPGITKLLRNEKRLGTGPSRHRGVLAAQGEYVLSLDAHMRFQPDWLPRVLHHVLASDAKTVWCGCCCAVEDKDTSIVGRADFHQGASWNFHGPFKDDPDRTHFFDVVWHKAPPGPTPEIPAVMGACYVFNREFFLKLNAWRHLRGWGALEANLSLKTWLSGGEIRLMRDVVFGHVFYTEHRGHYGIKTWEGMYNKFFAIRTMLPAGHAERLLRKLKVDTAAYTAHSQLERDWHTVEIERDNNQTLFTRTFQWYLDKFGLQFPGD